MVLTSVYLSVNTSLPSTSNIKPVEIWLIFNLSYPFLVILVNVVIQVIGDVGPRIDARRYSSLTTAYLTLSDPMFSPHGCYLTYKTIKLLKALEYQQREDIGRQHLNDKIIQVESLMMMKPNEENEEQNKPLMSQSGQKTQQELSKSNYNFLLLRSGQSF